MARVPQTFDVIVIGAGPAGGAAALELANTRLRFAVLEANTWPRHKPCGGALPFPARTHLPIDWTSLWSKHVTRVISRFRGEDERMATMADPAVLMIDRSEFDAAIIAAAMRLAAGRMRFETRSRIQALTETCSGDYDLTTVEGRRYRASHVVIATGSHARLARTAGLTERQRPALAIECEVQVSAECYHREAERLTFDYGCSRGGYAWIFPKAPYVLACGIGGHSSPRELKARLSAFLEQRLGATHIKHTVRHGHPLAVHQPSGPLGRNGILLTGDAASLIDPISGEGIWYAIRSGQLAGQALAQSFSTGARTLAVDHYKAAIEREISPGLDACAQLALPDLLDAPEYFYRRFLATGHSYHQLYQALHDAARAAYG